MVNTDVHHRNEQCELWADYQSDLDIPFTVWITLYDTKPVGKNNIPDWSNLKMTSLKITNKADSEITQNTLEQISYESSCAIFMAH